MWVNGKAPERRTVPEACRTCSPYRVIGRHVPGTQCVWGVRFSLREAGRGEEYRGGVLENYGLLTRCETLNQQTQ